MADDRITHSAEAALAVGEAEGLTSEVEDELFRFARALEGSDELRMTLTDPAIPVARRQQIVEDLLGGPATRATTALVSMVVAAGRAADLPRIADRMVQLGAERRERAVAEVRSVVDLTPDQRSRLAAALEQATGRDIELRVVVDDTLMGGLLVQIDDEVIDGTIRTQLKQLREAF